MTYLRTPRKFATWHKIYKDPAMWRVINMDYMFKIPSDWPQLLRKMCKHVVVRNQGQLVDLTISGFADEELLEYIADRSSQLKRLHIRRCEGNLYESWAESLKKLPLLEELSLYKTDISKEGIETAGRCCPMLTTLIVDRDVWMFWVKDAYDEIAIAIGENLHELRHLELIGNNITNTGLQVILDGCLHLELLDLRLCFNIDLKGDLGKTCWEKIKCLKPPYDFARLYPYDKEFEDFAHDSSTESEDYVSSGDDE